MGSVGCAYMCVCVVNAITRVESNLKWNSNWIGTFCLSNWLMEADELPVSPPMCFLSGVFNSIKKPLFIGICWMAFNSIQFNWFRATSLWIQLFSLFHSNQLPELLSMYFIHVSLSLSFLSLSDVQRLFRKRYGLTMLT